MAKAETRSRQGEIGNVAAREKLDRLIHRLKPAAPRARQIPRRPAGVDRAPLTRAQERLWLHDRLHPGSPAYHLAGAIHLAGDVDVAALRRAVARIVRRHEALRTVFAPREGEAVQVVLAADELLGDPAAPASGLPLPVVDLVALAEEPRERARRRHLDAAARAPFDLERGPLLRTVLLRLAPRRHVLAVVLHHIVADGWSLGVFVRELAAFYGGGTAPEEPTVQLADVALWQRGNEPAAADGNLDVWRRELQGVPPLALAPGRSRPAPRFLGGRREISVPAATARRLEALARREGLTLTALLVAAWGAFLARLSGDVPAVLVGIPLARRAAAELEGLIGFLVDTVPVRVDLGGAPGFAELARRVGERILAVRDRGEPPLEDLVREAGLLVEPGRAPFQAVLTFDPQPLETTRAGDLELRIEPLGTGSAKFDLTLMLEPAAEGLAGVLEYDRDLFDASTIGRYLEAFSTFLDAAAAAPGSPVRDLGLVGGAAAELLDRFNLTATDYPRDATLDELFRRRAAERPEATALRFDDGTGDAATLTYGEVARRASRLAARLAALGVGPDVKVGLCLERSPEAVISILAVLEAGGAYVPLDPEFPEDRLAFMIDDAATPVLVVDPALRGRLPGRLPAGVRLVDPRDAEAAEGGGLPPAGPRSGARNQAPNQARNQAQNLAYVMYTSGSTGRPKGVAVTHRNVVRLVLGTDYLDFGPDRVFLLSAPTSFDASTLEIWGALLNGATLAIAPPLQSLEGLGRQIERHGVDVLWLTAGLFHSMVEEHGEALRPLRFLLAGGDVLQAPHVRAAAELVSGRLLNGYGPTENTTFTTVAHLPPKRPEGASVPIGRPIKNTTVHVVDRRLRRLPIGVAGQLVTGGDGVARGYLGRPGRTAGVFVPDPFAAEPGRRLYLTGDLARFREDGALDFLGRVDRQIKVRGFRIEPGEIEAALHRAGRHLEAPLGQAVVVARRDRYGNRRLVAYVTPEEGTPGGEDLARRLEADLAEHLPTFMVPSAVAILDAFPLGATGKVDTARLPDPEWRHADQVAPRGPVEELLAEIWTEILGVDRVGAHDDFFALGGHSLSAARFVAHLYKSTGVELPLREVFDKPTVEDLAPAVTALLAPGGTVALPPIERAEPAELGDAAGDTAPASFAQERLWFLDRLEPGRATYNVPLAGELRGPIDPAALAAALEALAWRHEPLRTVFAEVEGRPVQRILAPSPVAFTAVDLGRLAPAAAEAAVRCLVAREARRPFDVAAPPLWRAGLFRLTPWRHVLFLNFHHVVVDGGSLGPLGRDLGVFYGAASSGAATSRGRRAPELPDLPVRYRDFAAWQRRTWDAGRLADGLDFWCDHLAGAPPLELPTDRPRPARPRERGGFLEVGLSAELTERLAELSRREGATLFMGLLAGFAATLGHTAGQDDLTLGTPAAGRPRAEVEDLIGVFINTLALRLDLAGDPTFDELLARVCRTTLDGFKHRDVPFAQVLEALPGERDLSRTPLFQAMLVLNPDPVAPLALGAAELSPWTVPTGTAKLEILLELHGRAGGGLAGFLEYDRDLFDLATVERLWQRALRLFEAVAEEPGACLSETPWLSPAEERRVLDAWNATRLAEPRPSATLERLVAEQAAERPGAVAILDHARAISYAELDAASNRLAHHLRDLGVGEEAIVGVCLERGAELVVALLAVLKAGAAYVPLDPSYPVERLALILEDTGARVVLTREGPAACLPPVDAATDAAAEARHDVDLGREAAAIAGRPATPLPSSSAPGHDGRLAYLVYTSGSTGRPKGVAIAHPSAVALVRWALEAFPFEAFAGTLAATSINFDLSIFEIFVPLAAGGTVVMAESALELAELPDRDAVTLVNTVPSAMAELVRSGGLPAAARFVSLAGEPLRRALVDEIYAAAEVEEVWNLYGPSEDTTYSTFVRVPRSDPGEPTIGRPVGATRAYLLDRHGRAVGPGVVGELYLGGAGLARGYLARPALTAERFVPDPFAAEVARPGGARGGPGGRLYRTGDLARYRDDGELVFLGRADHQVKVRGFRVEPGEIEVVLAAHGAVREAVVLARTDGAGTTFLAAFVVPESAGSGRGLEIAGLREHLAARLPPYMVPTGWRVVPELPRLPNSKIDRGALARLELRAEHRRETRAPSTAAERTVAETWCEVLGREEVGVGDHFFELGGHSLAAARVVARIRGRLGVDVPLRRLFENPVLADLAKVVEAAAACGGAAVPLVPRPPEEGDPASYHQERLWFLEQLDPDHPAYNIPLALSLAGPLDVVALAWALAEVAGRHDVLSTVFEERAGHPVPRPGPGPELVVADFAALPAERRAAAGWRLVERLVRRPLDLERGPLLTFTLVRLGRESHLALLNVHHIVADGWSMGILARELGAFYGRATGAADVAVAPPPPVRYADWAAWQRRWLEGEAEAATDTATAAADTATADLDFWRRRLAEPPTLELPGRPRPAVLGSAGETVEGEVPAEVTRALATLAGARDATLFTALLAAYGVLLRRFSGEVDLTVGTPVAGRDEVEVEGLVGLFVNTLVLRLDLAGDPTFDELLVHARDVFLEAEAHRRVPFERVVEAVGAERSLSRTPLFQTMLILQGDAWDQDAFPGLAAEVVPVANGTAKLDLTLSLNPRAGALLAVLEYKSQLFDAAMVRRFFDVYQRILAAVAADPSVRLSRLLALDADERRQLEAWSRGDRTYSRRHADALFRAQARKTPRREALVAGDEILTYRELDDRVEALSRLLGRLSTSDRRETHP